MVTTFLCCAVFGLRCARAYVRRGSIFLRYLRLQLLFFAYCIISRFFSRTCFLPSYHSVWSALPSCFGLATLQTNNGCGGARWFPSCLRRQGFFCVQLGSFCSLLGYLKQLCDDAGSWQSR